MSFSTVYQNINTTVVQTQNNSSTVESQFQYYQSNISNTQTNQHQQHHNNNNNQQPLLSLNQIIGCCDHRQNIVKHQSMRSCNDQGESMPKSMNIKKNCIDCGVFISKADISPQENYENLLDDEYQQSYYHFYQQYAKDFTDQDRYDLNQLRTVNIERIFYFGDKLRQSQQTVYLACAYFDLLLFRQFVQDQQKQNNTFRIESQTQEQSVERQRQTQIDDLLVICQTPINEKVRDRTMNLKAQMCLLLASKFDELDEYIPLIRDFQKLARYEFAYNECQNEEEAILKQLNWSLSFITPYHVLESLIQQGIVFEDDKIRSGSNLYENRQSSFNEETLRMIRKKSEFFCRLAIISNFDMQMYQPSHIAMSCVLASRLACQVVPWWNEKLIELTQMNIYSNKELRECFDRLYMLYDENYVPQALIFNKTVQKFKSTISTCDPNTLNHTQINGLQQRKSKILEQNQNITNDSFIATTSNNKAKDQDTVPRYAENEYNYDVIAGDESVLSKKQIENLPESHIDNRQSQVNLNLQYVNNNNHSNRTSSSNLQTTKYNKQSENYLSDSSATVKNFLVSKRKSDFVKFNKENQGMSSVKSMIQTIHLEQKQGRQLQQSNSVILKDENNNNSQKYNQLEQSRTFNSSQVFNIPAPRCSTIITNHVNLQQNVLKNQHQGQVNSDVITELKHRNSSVTSLGTQITQQKIDSTVQQKTVLLKLNNLSNKMTHEKLSNNVPKQQQKQIKTVRMENNQAQNKKQKQRKLSTCSNTSINKLQNTGSLTRKPNNSSILNQRLGTSTNEYMAGRSINTKQTKSSRNSTSIGLNDTITKDTQKNDLKLEELRLKYQSENTIYEKKVFGKPNDQQGRNLQHSMLSGFHAHSKTYAALNPQHILNKKSISRERSISECELYSNPYGNLNLNVQKSSIVKKIGSGTQKQIQSNLSALQQQECDNEQIYIKNTIVIEEDQEGDKTQNELSMTHAYAEELIPTDEDSVVIKKPMSSRKSKSIENVNKFISQRRKSSNASNNTNSINNVHNTNSNKAIIEIYKRQYNQIKQTLDKNSTNDQNTRNILSQTQTKVATIDLQNFAARPPSHHNNNSKMSYIKKNITYVNTISNNQLQQSMDVNTSIESNNIPNDLILTQSESYNMQSKRVSRCSNQQYPQSTTNQMQRNVKKKLSSQIVKQSLSKRRISQQKQNNNILNQSNVVAQQNNLSTIRKSTQQNTIRLLLNHKSQANIIEQRKSLDPKLRTNQHNAKESSTSAINKLDTNINKNRNQGSTSINLSACSSQVQLKERPFTRFLNPENKQLFNAFSKNFKNQKKTPTPQQSQKINFEQMKVKVISPENQAVQKKSTSLLNALKSQQKNNQNYVIRLNTSRHTSNHSTSCDVMHPQLSNRSGNVSARQYYDQQHSNKSSTQNLVIFQKFQARQPMKQQNHSLIERALMKKSQLTNMLKPYSTKQAAQTLDNTCESTYEDKPCSRSNNRVINNTVSQHQPKNLSVNNSSLMLPVLTQNNQNQVGSSSKNMRISHVKSPSYLVQTCSSNPQDIPPPLSGRPSKINLVPSNNISINQSVLNANNLSTHHIQAIHNKPPLLSASCTTQNLLNHPQKLHKNPELRAIQLHVKNNSGSQNTTKLPFIQPPISARVSNRYAKDLSTCCTTTEPLIIKEEDEFKKLTQQFKKQISKITNNSSSCN